LIYGLCEDDKTDQAAKLFDEMVVKSFLPDVVTYTTLIKGFLRQGWYIQMFDEMVSKGCVPNCVTHETIIEGLRKTGKVKTVVKLLKDMALASPLSSEQSMGRLDLLLRDI